MRKAQGFQAIKQFAHKPKVRRNATRITGCLQGKGCQKVEMTSWDHLAATKRKVDVERVNWQGLIVYSAEVFDPKPRIARIRAILRGMR